MAVNGWCHITRIAVAVLRLPHSPHDPGRGGGSLCPSSVTHAGLRLNSPSPKQIVWSTDFLIALAVPMRVCRCVPMDLEPGRSAAGRARSETDQFPQPPNWQRRLPGKGGSPVAKMDLKEVVMVVCLPLLLRNYGPHRPGMREGCDINHIETRYQLVILSSSVVSSGFDSRPFRVSSP